MATITLDTVNRLAARYNAVQRGAFRASAVYGCQSEHIDNLFGYEGEHDNALADALYIEWAAKRWMLLTVASKAKELFADTWVAWVDSQRLTRPSSEVVAQQLPRVAGLIAACNARGYFSPAIQRVNRKWKARIEEVERDRDAALRAQALNYERATLAALRKAA